MPNESGIQIIRSKPFGINVIDRLILKIKNIQSIHQWTMSIKHIIIINGTTFVLNNDLITINFLQT
uniref:Uncharacterized protein n=1 Tax=Arundo donax TaxID=35708 RepID=A0A0A9DTR7_ARUDO